MKHIKFPSINQYRDLIKNVNHTIQYSGKDENGEVIMDRNAVMPTLKMIGTEKLHGCVSKNTNILMHDNTEKSISDIKVGDKIYSYNVNTNKQEIDTVKKLIIQDLKKEWIKLYFNNGKTLKCTKDHKILTENGWKEADLLTDKDEIIGI